MQVSRHSPAAVPEVWWGHLPARLRRYSAVASAAWADGIYLTAWPRVAMLLPAVMLLVGILEGATHWSLLTIGDGSMSARIPAVAFAQNLPLVLLAAAVGALSANAGLMLVLGYALGDYVVAGSQFTIAGGLLSRFFYLRVPQLVSYLLFLLLAVMPTLSASHLVASLRRLVRRQDLVSKATIIVLIAAVQGVLVYGWTLATPMVIRILWAWPGAAAPVTVGYFQQVLDPWAPMLAGIAVLGRGWLTLRARRDPTVLTRVANLYIGLHDAKDRASVFRHLPTWLQPVLAGGLATLLMSGFIASRGLGLFVWVLTGGLLVVRMSVLPGLSPWVTWADLAERVPLIVRWVLAMLTTYGLTRFVVGLPGQSAAVNTTAGAFAAELVSLMLGLAVTMLLLTEGGEPRGRSEVRRQPGASAIRAVGALAFVALLTPKVYATCLDPFCCFLGNDMLAILAVVGLVAVVGSLVLWMLPVLLAGLVVTPELILWVGITAELTGGGIYLFTL